MVNKTDESNEGIEGYVINIGGPNKYSVGPAKVYFGRIDADAVLNFTRVCEQTGLIDKLKKDEP